MSSSLPRNPDPKPGETRIIIYGYIPSLPLGLACTILFGLFCLVHLAFGLFDGFLFRRRFGRHRSKEPATDSDHRPVDVGASTTSTKGRRQARVFSLLLSFGCLMEAVGYAFRVKNHSNPYLLNPFILQYFLIVCAPIFFTAAIYLCLAIVIRSDAALQPLCPLSPRFLIAFFVVADTLTIVMQVAGAALFGVAQSKIADNEEPPVSPQTANNILTAGLAVQTFFFTAFILVFAIFVRNASRYHHQSASPATDSRLDTASLDAEKVAPHQHQQSQAPRPDRLLLAVMAVSSFFIYLRTIFRLAEAIEGIYSKSATNEDLFGALEAAPVLVAVFVWAMVPLGWRISTR
ncbi:hypothetical protein ACQY0O_000475 [Thecaphora frezii]